MTTDIPYIVITVNSFILDMYIEHRITLLRKRNCRHFHHGRDSRMEAMYSFRAAMD